MSFSTIFSNLYANTYLYANGESIWKNVSANTLTTSGNAIIGGNATVQGNLIVVGNIYRQDEINIGNTVIIVAGNANTAAQASGAGIQVGNANYASFLWNSNANTWYTGSSNISAGYFLGNGSQLTGLDFTNYSNSNAAAYLASNAAITILTTGNITSAANIQGSYLLGNISSATGGYSNSNVAAYLPTYTGNLASLAGNVVTSANVQGAFILGNGAFLTGIAGTYGNADVANYLASNANLQITTQGNVTGNYFIGNGALLTGVGTSSYSNANVANYLVSINNVTIGTNAGNSNQGNRSVAIGYLAATGIVGNANAGQSIDAVAIGSEAGRYGQGSEAVAIGDSAGQTDQQFGAIAIGSGAASLRQKNGAVAIGEQAGAGDQNTYAVAIGSQAGLSSQGYAAIAIGRRAGQVNQPNNSIILNATGATLSGSNANALYIDPIRNDTGIGNVLFYNVNTKEITFAPEYNDTSVAAYLEIYNGNALFSNVTVTRDAVIQGNLRVQGNTTYINVDDLVIDDYLIIVGNAATQLSDLNGAGLQIGNLANGNIQFVYNSTSNVMTLNVGANIANVLNVEGNVTAAGNVQGSYVLGNGAFLTGLAATYSNANVAAYLASNANIAITTQGNITATYFKGDGSQLANLPLGNYSNSNVAAYLPTYTGNLASLTGNVTTTANVQGAYILGNGAFLSGISGTGNYSNANVAAYLPNYQGLISNIEFRSTSPAAAAIIVNDRSLTIGGNLLSYVILPDDGNANSVAAELTNHGLGNVIISSGPADYEWVFDNAGNLFAPGNIDAGNVISANYFLGNGAFLTGLPSGLSNADVANYLASNANVTILTTGNITTAANISGSYIFGNGAFLTGISGGGANLGNAIDLGTPTQGNLTSNAVTLTTTTTVTDGVALLNEVLGKLVPPRPSNFPAGQTLTITTSGTSARITNYVQPDNTPGANKSVAAGTLITAIRGSTYTTNTITNAGPGDTGTLLAVLNGANAGSATFNAAATPNVNGTYSNLVITNNYDYNVANASIAAGFWYVFSSRATGTVPTGWNEVYIRQTAVGNSAAPYWFYDSAAPGTPAYSNVSVTACATPTLAYTSTIPHYASGTTFGFGFSVNRLSGNTYPNSNNLSTGSSGGAFQAPASVTYAAAGITEPLAQNLYVSSGTATGNTTAGIVASGFGSSATGPSVTVNNSYNSAAQAFTTALAATVLFKNGNSTAIDEGNITVTSVGTGSGNAYRIINPGAGNTPAYTANATAFNSQSSTLQTYDATVVGSSSQGVMKHDQTNYSTGYLPAGPDLSAGRSGTQYFTFKFIRTGVSKFDIRYTGTVAGMWVALPGSVIDTSSSINGWMDMTQAYAGSGYPGVNVPGNGSDGCSLGGTVAVNTAVTNASKTCTFGTVSSSSTATNEIYIRIALTSGQSVTALTIIAATN